MRKIFLCGLGLFIFLEIIVSNTGWINYKLFWAEIILGLILLAYGISRIFKPDYLQFNSSLALPILTYLAWMVISLLFSPFKSAGTYGLYNFVLLAIFYFVLVNCVVRKEELDLLINGWVFLSVYICIYSLHGQRTVDLLSHRPAIAGTFGNPNLFAAFLVSTIPFSLIRYLQAKDRVVRIIYGLSGLILFAGLYMSRSRSGIGAGVFLILFFSLLFFSARILSEKKRRKMWKVIYFLSIAIVFGLGIIFHQKLTAFLDLKSRSYIWQGAWSMIREKPLAGWGIGNFVVFFPQYAPQQVMQIHPDEFVAQAHNEFLNIGAELGIIGLAIFLWLLFKIFLLAKRKILNKDNNYVRITALGAMSSIMGVIIINLFDVSLRFVFTAMFWWLAVAILVIVDKLERADKLISQGKRLPVFGRGMMGLGCVFLSLNLIACALHSLWAYRKYERSSNVFTLDLSRMASLMEEAKDKVRQGKADARIYFDLGTLYAQQADWEHARIYLEKAIELDRKSAFAHANLGNVYFNLNDIDKAIGYYRRALEISPDYLKAHYNLGFAYFKKIRLKEALEEFDFILRKDKRDFRTWQMRQLIFE